jgi:hypothetical protein
VGAIRWRDKLGTVRSVERGGRGAERGGQREKGTDRERKTDEG